MADSHARAAAPAQGTSHLPPRPLCGRLRGAGGRHPAHAESLRGRGGSGASPMGLRLSEEKTRIAHIDEGFDFLGFRIQRQQKRGTNEALRLHLAVEEVARLGQGQGADDHPAGNEPAALRPPAPAQPGAARLDQLLPARRVERRPSTTSRHSPGDGWSAGFAASTADANWKWLRRRYLPTVVADGGRGDAVQPGDGARSPVTATGDGASPRRG